MSTLTRSSLTRTSRRAIVAGLAISFVALPAFVLSPSASAAVAPTKAVESVSRGEAGVTAEAWAAGRKALGREPSSDEAVLAFWTPDRMKAAAQVEDSPDYKAALERYAKTGTSREAQDEAAKDEDTVPTSVEGDLGRLGAEPKARAAAKTATKSKGLRAAADKSYLPYNAPTARTAGKVFFTMNGLNYQCSGTIVNSEGRDTVWTAGHCVHGGSGGKWATNWQFVPAYNSASATPRPYGTWTASQLWSMTSWTGSSDFTADMGVAIMGTNSGNHIVSYLGGQGLRVNAGKYVWERAFGYPAEAPFGGGALYSCYGKSSPEWSFLWITSDTIKIPCNMTRGSSGGGWLNDWNGSWGYLNGVNSRIDKIVGPTIMLSPYFDNTALSLYNATRFL
jgi:V8-like Glu-specific endopeptidase